MALRLVDMWIWDFWLAKDRETYHIFYLQAPRSLEREERRHWNVSIGHAISTDLRSWSVMPDALHPGPPGAWDDYTTWTGSVIGHGGVWYLFYTGTHRAEDGLIQRIGLATSDDLIHWVKHPDNPLIEADPRWYELLDHDLWHDQAWRDPYVFQHPKTGTFHVYITARCNYGPADGRGVIGHATSDDLLRWQVLPPLTEPGYFGHLEIPQLIEVNTRYYLLFSTPAAAYSAQHKAQCSHEPVTGVHYFVADDAAGPFVLPTDEFLLGDRYGSLYGGKLVYGPEGSVLLLAWRQFSTQGEFVGEIIDPLPVMVDRAGRLSVKS